MPRLQPTCGADAAPGDGQSWTSDSSTMAAPLLMLPHSSNVPRGAGSLTGSSKARGAEGTGDPHQARGYRMTQGGRLLVIFSSGSPFLALRIASISCGDEGGHMCGSQLSHTAEPPPPHTAQGAPGRVLTSFS